jgi:NAD(P)H dehydrogenase (quinone)
MIIVTNATSPFGFLVIGHLLDHLEPGEVVVLAPDADRTDELAGMGVEVRQQRFDDPSAAAQAFTGADSALVISRLGDTGSGAPQGDAAAAVDAAIAAGVDHIAYTSIINADGTHHLTHLTNEGTIRDSGKRFTLLRSNLHSEALLPALQLASGSGELIWSAGDRLIAPAALTDYAEAAAIVLTDDHQASRTLQLSGPLGLKAAGIAAAFSQVLGRDVRVREVSSSELRAELTGAGASPQAADELDSIYNDTSQDEWSIATDTLEELIGHDRISLVDALGAATSPPDA